MNITTRRALSLGLIMVWLAHIGEQGCASDQAIARDAAVSWQSHRMQTLERQYRQLGEIYVAKQRANPEKGKHIHTETVQAYKRLLRQRLSYQDLQDLAASADVLPARFKDRHGTFSAAVLEYMIQVFLEMGDRESLIKLLSKRFVTTIGSGHWIEYYLASRTSLLQDFRGNRLSDPMLILGEAYSRCRTPEVREEIAAAVRRGFAGLGIDGKDDAEFVANAMQWYIKEKGHLTINDRYLQNDNMPLDGAQLDHNLPSTEIPGGRQPLFLRTSAQRGERKIMAVAMFWVVHLAIAAVLSAPIVFFGRRRVRWRPWELLALILPFSVWALLMVSPLSMGRKGLANLVEPFCLSLGVPIVAMMRVWTGEQHFRPASVSLWIAILVGSLCVVAAAIFFMVPPLLSIE